jgi:hypothetical protein
MARAQTMLDWAKARGTANATTFDDAEALAGEKKLPWRQRDRGFALLGMAFGRDRWRVPASHEIGYDLRLDGQLGFSVDGYEPEAFRWGTSSRLGLRFSLGGGSGNAHSEISGELSTGALFTLDRYGSGAIARVSGSAFTVLEPGQDVVLANVGVPMGFAFNQRGVHGELLFSPSLGWANVVSHDRNRGSGPLFLGVLSRFGSDNTWLEASFLRSAVGADVDSSRFSLCTTVRSWFLCTDGFWLHLNDIQDDEPASFARVGLRLGVGSHATRMSENPSGRPR